MGSRGFCGPRQSDKAKNQLRAPSTCDLTCEHVLPDSTRTLSKSGSHMHGNRCSACWRSRRDLRLRPATVGQKFLHWSRAAGRHKHLQTDGHGAGEKHNCLIHVASLGGMRQSFEVQGLQVECEFHLRVLEMQQKHKKTMQWNPDNPLTVCLKPLHLKPLFFS